MILQSLHELYSRLEKDPAYRLPPPGYSQQNISFILLLKPDGTLFGIQPMPDDRNARCLVVAGGDKPSGKVTTKSVHKKVCFLRNDMPFVVGAGVDDDGKWILCQMEFDAFKKCHLQLEPAIKDPACTALCTFLKQWSPEEALRHPEWAEFALGQGVIKIVGETEYLHEKPAFREWWVAHRPRDLVGSGECLVTGLSHQRWPAFTNRKFEAYAARSRLVR